MRRKGVRKQKGTGKKEGIRQALEMKINANTPQIYTQKPNPGGDSFIVAQHGRRGRHSRVIGEGMDLGGNKQKKKNRIKGCTGNKRGSQVWRDGRGRTPKNIFEQDYKQNKRRGDARGTPKEKKLMGQKKRNYSPQKWTTRWWSAAGINVDGGCRDTIKKKKTKN